MKSFTILSGSAYVVELPEGAETPSLIFMDGFWHLTYFTYDGEILTRKRLPKGRWRIIGMLSEVTEGQASELADGCYPTNTAFKYKDHKTGVYVIDTALESLDSSILAEGYLLESPPAPKCGCFGPAEEGACPACDEWVESQSRVLDRGRCLLLGREI